MFPIITSFVSATFFGLVCNLVIGTENLSQHAWIDATFWGLIGSGIAVSAIRILTDHFYCPVATPRVRSFSQMEQSGMGQR